MKRSRHTLFTVIAVLGLTMARVASAAEIPKVTLTASGPDADIPIGKSFYLASTVKDDVRAAQVFVVRKGSTVVVGGDSGPACSALKEALHPEVHGKTNVDAGVHPLREVYPASKVLRENRVLASARWERKSATGDQEFKLLVPGDSSFFESGFHYCLFVETSKTEVTTSEAVITAEVQKFVTSLSACTKGTNDETTAKQAECEAKQIAEYEKNLAAAATKVESDRGGNKEAVEAKIKTFRSAARDAADHLIDFTDAATRLGPFLDPTRQALPSLNTLPPGNLSVTLAAPASSEQERLDHLARAAALLLAWNPAAPGLLISAEGGRNRFRVGGTAVTRLSIAANGKTIQLFVTGKAGEKAFKSDVEADDLEIVPGVSLGDVVLLLNNQIVVAKTKYTLSDLGRAIQTGSDLATWTKEQTSLVTAAHEKVAALANALALFAETSRRAKAGEEIQDDTPAAIRIHLDLAIGKTSEATAKLQAWSQALNKLATSQASWEQAKVALAVKTEGKATVEVAAPIATEIEFSEKTWVFSYLTPVLGYAQIRTDGNFALFYIAAQLHFFPNPGSDVLWSKGFVRDLKRSFAIELGFSPKVTSFGPDKRLSGYSGFPPAYIGVALHLIPYTSFSFGGVLLDRKSSSLADETADVTFKPYFGFNVQFNIPDYVREAAKPPTNTTVTTSAPAPAGS